MRRPLPLIAFGLAGGILLSSVLGLWSLPCVMGGGLIAVWTRRARKALLPCCAALVGSLWLLVTASVWPGGYGAAASEMAVQRIEANSGGVTLTVALRSLAGKPVPAWNPVRAALYLQGDTKYGPGDILRAEVDWQQPASPANPGEFDYAAYQKRQGILATAYLTGDRSLELVSGALGRGNNSRQTLRVRASGLPGQAGELLSTLLLGETPGDWAACWRQAGLAHVLAVSGLHVGLLLAMLLRLLAWMRVPPLWRYLLGASALIAYGLLIGSRPSVWRAIIMALIGLLALATGRLRDWPSALAAAAILLLLHNPRLLFDAGWELSFAATWGVLALSPLIVARLPLLPLRLDRAIATSLAAQAATLPIVLYYFYLINPLAILSNLVMLPFLPLLLILGAVYLALSPLAGWLAPLVGWVFGIAQCIVEWLARVPGMTISLGQPPLWLVGLSLLLLGLCWYLQAAKTRRWLVVGWLVVTLLATGWQPILRFALNRYQLRVLAVGQGASSVVHLPDSRALLFDVGGGSDSVGRRIIVPYLRQQGTLRVSAIYLSHLDSDHVRGLTDVLASFPVDRIYLAASAQSQPWYSVLAEMATRYEIQLHMLGVGDQIVERALHVSVLHPSGTAASDDANEDSLVLQLDWPNLCALLPGDIGAVTESEIRSRVSTPLDVLLVAHHGSANSSGEQFLSSLAPMLSIISTGPNQYGHPAPAAVMRLERYSQQVLRTDQAGAVLVWTDLRRRGVSTFRAHHP